MKGYQYRIEEMSNGEFRIYQEFERYSSFDEKIRLRGIANSLDEAKLMIDEMEVSKAKPYVIGTHIYKGNKL